MKHLQNLMPIILGLIVMIGSWYFDFTLTEVIESDKNLAAKVIGLLDQQLVDEEAQELATISINTIVENKHWLLQESNDVVWAIGLCIVLWNISSVFSLFNFRKPDAKEGKP